jgi:uncharacterized cofD-like protein
VVLQTEGHIYKGNLVQGGGVEELWLDPPASANPAALAAIRAADAIIICPGNLACSILPNFLVGGVVPALRTSSALKICVANLLNQRRHVPTSWTPLDYVRHLELECYLGSDFFDLVVCNSEGWLAEEYVRKHGTLALGASAQGRPRVLAQPLLSKQGQTLATTDALAHLRSPVLHDPTALAQALEVALQGLQKTFLPALAALAPAKAGRGNGHLRA